MTCDRLRLIGVTTRVAVFVCLTAACAARAFAQVSAPGPGVPPGSADGSGLGLSMILTAFIVMLGPIKLVGPFAALTAGMTEGEARKIALKAFGFACAGGLAAALVGQNMLVSWRISPAALHLTVGVVLLLVALRTVLAQYEPAVDSSTPVTAPRNIALSPLTFPTILTPHGIAIFTLFLAVTGDASREASIIALFLAVMAMNWIAMWFARPIVRHAGIVFAILGAVLGVLQVALGIQIVLRALGSLHVIPTV